MAAQPGSLAWAFDAVLSGLDPVFACLRCLVLPLQTWVAAVWPPAADSIPRLREIWYVWGIVLPLISPWVLVLLPATLLLGLPLLPVSVCAVCCSQSAPASTSSASVFCRTPTIALTMRQKLTTSANVCRFGSGQLGFCQDRCWARRTTSRWYCCCLGASRPSASARNF